MDISERKIVYKEGQRPKYIFDIIEGNPEWIGLLIEGKTFHGPFELNDIEKTYYELAILEAPHTDIRLDVNILKQALAPYLQEPIFEDCRLQLYTEELYKSIEKYNKSLDNGFKLNPFREYFNSYIDSPYEAIIIKNTEVLYPRLRSDFCNVQSYVGTVKQRLQGIRSKYNKGNLNEELYQSEERVRSKLKDMEVVFYTVLISYGKELQSYFDDWRKYMYAKTEANNMFLSFHHRCHCREYMTFGRYRNKSVSSIIRKDIGYIKWALKNSSGFTLKGDDLEEFIEKAGYDPYAISSNINAIPSDETLVDLASFLGSPCNLESVVFSVSHQPDMKALMSLTEKYPSLRYNITSKGDLYLITLSGDFEDKNNSNCDAVPTDKDSSHSERTVREIIY